MSQLQFHQERRSSVENLRLDPAGLTCASLCWLSASPGEISACLASCISSAEPSITLRAESSMAAAALGSVVEAATPRAACAKVLRAWAVSLAAIPATQGRHSSLLFCLFVTTAHTHSYCTETNSDFFFIPFLPFNQAIWDPASVLTLQRLHRSCRLPNTGKFNVSKVHRLFTLFHIGGKSDYMAMDSLFETYHHLFGY